MQWGQSPLHPWIMARIKLFTDSTGMMKYGIGADASAAFMLRAGISGQLLKDDDGNVGILISPSFGGGSPSIGISTSLTVTNADTIYDLKNFGTSIGGSASLLPCAPGVGIQYLGSGCGVHGVNISVDWDAKPWAEGHGEASWTWIIALNGEQAEQAREKINETVIKTVNKLPREIIIEIEDKLGIDLSEPDLDQKIQLIPCF